MDPGLPEALALIRERDDSLYRDLGPHVQRVCVHQNMVYILDLHIMDKQMNK